MSFRDWLKNDAYNELQEAVNDNLDNGLVKRKEKLMGLYNAYLQKQLVEKTWFLAIATWVLAIVTILLALS